MSVAIELPAGSHLHPDRTQSRMSVFGATVCLSSGTRSIVSSQISRSRSREPSPCEKLTSACKGCGGPLSTGSGVSSPKMSPLLTTTRIKVTRVSSATKLGSSSPLITSEQISTPVSPSIVCEKLKNLTIGSVSDGLGTSELHERLEQSTDKVFLLDCRPFIAYNMVHIRGAFSMNCCDRLTKKRLHCGKIQLVDIISGEDGKEEFRKRKGVTDIVVYDEEGKDMDKQGPPSSLKLVVNTLKKEGVRVFYLRGGLSAFQNEFSEWCTKPDYKPPPKLLYSPTTPQVVDDQIDTAVVSEILPFLYIGNERDVANLDLLKENGITHVLNVTSHIPLHFETQGIIYKRLPASDSGQQNLKQYFNDAFSFIEDVKNNGGKVLVHCQAGVSRSATITISYIMKHIPMTMMDAFRFVKSKRSIVSPNFNFMGQLYEYEQQLAGGKTPKLLEPPVPFEVQMQCGNL